MDIEEIQKEWSEDSKIDDTQLDTESLKIPTLHSKYLSLLNEESRVHRKMAETHKMLVQEKIEYYSGHMTQEELKERGWEPFDIKVLKQDLPRYVESDPIVIQNVLLIGEQRERVETIKSILTTINNRSFHIQNAINWRKFTNGIN